MTGQGTSAVRAEVYGMLREVHVRATAFVTDGNPAPLLAEDAEGLLKRLRWAAESFPTDGRLALGVLRELFRAHWFRSLALPDPHGQADFDVAMLLFVHLWPLAPGMVPPEVREAFEAVDGFTGADDGLRTAGQVGALLRPGVSETERSAATDRLRWPAGRPT